MLNLTD